MRFLYVILILIGLYSCHNDTIYIGHGKDVIVTLEIIDAADIEKIVFSSYFDTAEVKASKIGQYKNIKFGFQTDSESIFEVCVYKKKDSLCTSSYVENGYRPHLKCTANKIEFNHFVGY